MQFRQSRTKLGFVAGPAAFATVVLAFFGFVVGHLEGLWAYIGVSLFAPLALAAGLTAIKAAMALANPATIASDAHGITYRAGGKTQHFAWGAIAAVIIFSPESRFRSPGLELTAPVNGRRFVSFGRNWEGTPEAIVEALDGEKAAHSAKD